MCTSVPHTPARRTRISTSSSRIVGTGTFLSTKPGPAVSFTSAFIWCGLWDQRGEKRSASPEELALGMFARKAGEFVPEREAVAAASDHRLNLSAIHLDHCTGHEAGALGRQDSNDRGHLLGIPRASNRYAVRARVQQLVDRPLLTVGAHACELERACRVEVSGEHGVHEHVVPCAFVGKRFREPEKTGARGVRKNEPGNGLLRRHRGEEDDASP